MRAQVLSADAPGVRLDLFLAQRLGRYSRSTLKALIARGCVRVGGAPAKPDYRLRGEERIEVFFPAPDWEAPDFEDWVIHEDRDLLVLDKPAGLLMHPAGACWLKAPEAALVEEEASLAGLLQLHRPALLASGVARCGLVHRLDRQTSGVLLVSKTPKVQATLLAAFRDRRIAKFYRAIVRGVPAQRRPLVCAPVGREPRGRVRVTPFGRPAQTAFEVLESGSGAALLEARPLTGRTHQIRAHLALLGHPVMGDPEFDRPRQGQPWPERLMLHAFRLELAHPVSGRRACFKAELPRDFRAFWRLCRV